MDRILFQEGKGCLLSPASRALVCSQIHISFRAIRENTTTYQSLREDCAAVADLLGMSEGRPVRPREEGVEAAANARPAVNHRSMQRGP